jgi:hypothetical protein
MEADGCDYFLKNKSGDENERRLEREEGGRSSRLQIGGRGRKRDFAFYSLLYYSKWSLGR